MYAGLPFYFVNPSDTVGTTTPVGSTGFTNGLGNAYAAMRFAANHPAADFSSTVLVTAPTGDKDKGFSTGRVTADWTNTFSHKFSAVTPFGSAGIANTVSDTSFFARPFTSVGFVSHFDGGATFRLTDFAEAGASAYAVRGSGQQTLFSKGRKGQNSGGTGGLPAGSEIVGSAELANDHGFSTWVSVPKSSADFQIGYTRSVNYDLNTLFFGVGFRIGK